MLPTDGVSMIGLHGELGNECHYIMVERFGQADESIDKLRGGHVLCLDKSYRWSCHGGIEFCHHPRGIGCDDRHGS